MNDYEDFIIYDRHDHYVGWILCNDRVCKYGLGSIG